MQAGNVSFKVVLKDKENGGNNELRRFLVGREDSASFFYLQQKMYEVFPQLSRNIFSVSWTDEEGDMVTIGTDEELKIALAGMPGPIYKLFACVTSKKKDESFLESKIHYGVTCDACDKKPIKGIRYKCLVCDDYDLCETCQASNRHPGHKMRRIDNPKMKFSTSLFKNTHRVQEIAEKNKTTGNDSFQLAQIHYGITCDDCDMTPIEGQRYKCVVCDDYDLCGTCKAAGKHPGHKMKSIDNDMIKRIKKLNEKAETQTHHGVTCDICDKTPIVGNRYKCTECDDYDLCAVCKASDWHPTHNMIKIDNPKKGFPHNVIKKQREAIERIGLEKKRTDLEKKIESCVTLSTGSQPANTSPTVNLPNIPECPVCLEEMKPPLKIFNCRNGHLICSVCRPKVSICTNCREEYTGRATAIEQMLREMFNC